MILPISYDEIIQYKKLAEQSGLCFAKNTIYFANYNNGNLVGFFGIIQFKNKIIIKNIFIFETYRGNGYFKEMLDFAVSQSHGKKIEATCTEMSIKEFVRRGFKLVKKYNYYTKVVL